MAPGDWTRYAPALQDAGAAALELNVYFVPTDPELSPEGVEQQYLDLATSVRQSISIPLSIKMGPFFTNVAYTARRLVQAGAAGLVLFNRYLEPDINVDKLQVEPKLNLSSRAELRLALRWIAILHGRVDASLAATGGIHSAEDVVKVLLAGADAAMLASVLLLQGPQHLATLLADLQRWLQDHRYSSVAQLKGSLDRGQCPDASAWERANYTRALVAFST